VGVDGDRAVGGFGGVVGGGFGAGAVPGVGEGVVGGGVGEGVFSKGACYFVGVGG